jgi:hypothetical protein
MTARAPRPSSPRYRARLLSTIAAACLVTACQSGPGTSSHGAGPPIISMAPSNSFSNRYGPRFGAKPFKRSTTLSSSSKSWVDANGTRHTKSSRVSASVSVDPNAMGNAMAMLIGAAAAGNGAPARAISTADVSGDWMLDVGGKQCRMSLRPPVGGSSGFASAFGCFNTEMQDIRKWSLRGDEVYLTGMFDKRVAILDLTGPRRMDGDTENAVDVVAWR